MEKFPCVNVLKKDLERCLVVVELTENVMENPCSIYFLDRRNNIVVDEIVENTNPPKFVTRVKLKVLPTEIGYMYYSLNGIETIIFNLFRNNIKPFDDDIKGSECYLKVYYEKDEFYSIPVISIELLFLKKLHPKTIDRFYSKMKSEIVLFTSQVGDVDIIEIHNTLDFVNLLNVSLYVGCPVFNNEGLFKRKRFSPEQLLEMNHFHGIPPMKLNMEEVVNNRLLSLFDEIRECIDYSVVSKVEPSQSELNNIINSMLIGTQEEEDLPF
jgi:hypothetical protein